MGAIRNVTTCNIHPCHSNGSNKQPCSAYFLTFRGLKLLLASYMLISGQKFVAIKGAAACFTPDEVTNNCCMTLSLYCNGFRHRKHILTRTQSPIHKLFYSQAWNENSTTTYCNKPSSRGFYCTNVPTGTCCEPQNWIKVTYLFLEKSV